MYREYAEKAYKLEEVMKDAQSVVRQFLPAFETALKVVERSGITQICGVGEKTSLAEIADAIGQCCQSIPEKTRRVIEQGIRRERNGRDRLRESMSIDD
jgi:hypothetical protein